MNSGSPSRGIKLRFPGSDLRLPSCGTRWPPSGFRPPITGFRFAEERIITYLCSVIEWLIIFLRCRTMTSPWTYWTTPRAAADCSAKRIMPNRRLSMSRIKQVLRCYVAGKGTRSISDLLDISRNTVKKYISIFNLSGKHIEEILAKKARFAPPLQPIFVESRYRTTAYRQASWHQGQGLSSASGTGCFDYSR